MGRGRDTDLLHLRTVPLQYTPHYTPTALFVIIILFKYSAEMIKCSRRFLLACLPDRTWSCILFALSNAENASHRVVGPIRDANRCHACHNKESNEMKCDLARAGIQYYEHQINRSYFSHNLVSKEQNLHKYI